MLDADTQINLASGFDAELLYSVPKSQGSWVAMTFDPKGRLIVSDQDDKGVFRVTLPKEGDADGKVQVESLNGFPFVPVAWGKRTVAGALGFLWAFDSLYMSTMKGFYRVRDTNGDDTFDEFTLLKELHPGWEHSAHAIIKTEDGEALYLTSGNHSALPDGVSTLQPQVWALDSLLPAMPDPSGHAVGVAAPGGWICRISPDGKDWRMIASGFRNSVDLAINREGELFTYDSDLEFDVGSPWYRPTRINHVTSASEFGWRAGSAKWPDYFPDSNGSVVDMGPGSPTGISFGHHSNFPDVYQDKLFVCDWTFGTIFTIDMDESGSSYVGTKKEFLNGTPLNISAMRFGPDGHMYFLVGGRNTDSKLYRVRYTGKDTAGPKKQLTANQGLRDLRHSLEALHGNHQGGSAAITKAWPHLSHDDRSIRYAARLAIENQDLELWQAKALAETNARAAMHAMIALCRHGEKSLSSRVIAKLNSIELAGLTNQDLLTLLRAYSLCLIRLDVATPTERDAIIKKLDPLYPATDEQLNTELCRLLSYLDAPSVVDKTIALMKVTQTKTLAFDKEMLTRHNYGKPILQAMANTPNTQNIHYAYCLRRVQNGWTLDSRKFFFAWLKDTLEKSGGQSFAGYIRAIREDAIEHLPAQDAASVAWLIGDVAGLDLSTLPSPTGPPELWTTDAAMALFQSELKGRNFDNGKLMFSAGKCIACHRFQGTGGRCGPDLGSLANRFSVRDILTSICEPSHTISEQYQASLVTLKDGNVIYGRIIYQDDQEIAVAANPYNFAELSKAPVEQIAKIELSPQSMMPEGTIAMMNKNELRDLMAYLLSGGNKRHKVFQK
jgi:putative heme-binding domain-containing protein